jgi:hypothetical protein
LWLVISAIDPGRGDGADNQPPGIVRPLPHLKGGVKVTPHTFYDGGKSLTCSSSVPNSARAVKVTVAGAAGSVSGSARPKKGKRSATYSLTLRPKTALPAGRYVYKQVATTTKKGPKLLVVRVITLS